MYRVVLYHLCLLLVVALVYSVIGWLSFSPQALLFSVAVITAACWISNEMFAWAWRVTPNVESVYITAFILAVILTPIDPGNLYGAALLVAGSVAAIGSKFILAPYKTHIFNPAALGVLVLGLCFGSYASWWVAGNTLLMPFVLIGGLLVVRKIQRFDLFWCFSIVTIAGIVISFLPLAPLQTIQNVLLHSSLLFFATVMLTEPFTMPPTRIHRLVYGAIVGFLFIPNIHIASFYTSPELALLVGNIYAYLNMPKSRRVLTLVETKQIAEGIYDFIFRPDTPLAFRAGQYLEWTLGHKKSDSRGNRRYFTLASSPTEELLHLGIKTYDPASSFKTALLALAPGNTITVAQLSGEFTLPKEESKKLAFVAGGIGITPFRSMAQYMIDTNQKRDAILLYSTKTPAEVAYKEVFTEAQEKIGMKTHYTDMITKDALVREVPDYKERMFYLSGPHGMVIAFEKTLKELGVPRSQIKVDFFPGFV